MPRPRVNYASLALYAGPSPATGAHFLSGVLTGALGSFQLSGNLINEIFRVQSCNERHAVTRTNISQLGEFAPLDRIILTSPEAGFDFTYLLANFTNEAALGFVTNGTCSCISGILNGTRDERNYFLRVGADGVDEIGDTTTNCSTMALGNGFVSSYSVTAAVGRLPEVSVKVDGLNLLFQNSPSGASPAIIPSNGNPVTGYAGSGFQFVLPTAVESPGSTAALLISALRPGDITLSIFNSGTNTVYSQAGATITDAKIQSFNLGVNMSRDEIQQLGSKYAITRTLRFPIDISLSIDAVLGDLTTGNLANMITCDQDYDVVIEMKSPDDCLGTAKTPICRYIVRNANLNSQDYSASVGNNTTVRLDFTSQVGGPNQTQVGLFMSGIAATPAGF